MGQTNAEPDAATGGGEVVLAEGYSGSDILHQLVLDATREFEAAFAHMKLETSAKQFRASYPQLLPQFEQARLASPDRRKIAHHMCHELQRYILWQAADQTPLHEALQAPLQPLALKSHEFQGNLGWTPEIVYQGQRYAANQLSELGQHLAGKGMVSEGAGQALTWLQAHALNGGQINLQGRKIAVLGGGAEMAPTRFWLEAGADVLWLDVQPPPEDWFDNNAMSGRLHWSESPVDLLTQPQAILATLKEFAQGDALDLGLYAYAPGKAREVRLTATMNALVDALPQDIINSVTILVSPTTPTALSYSDLTTMTNRRAQRPWWEALCSGLGLMGRGSGSFGDDSAAVSRTVVGIQGASYQAAQYLGKILMAEVWAGQGQLNNPDPSPLRVSANTAAITRTRSLSHPVFTAAFGGAAALSVETMTPRQSRRLNGLLALHDWLRPEMPVPGEVRVHGGIHTLPYPLESALRVAAAIGFVRSPRLLKGLFGG